MKSLHEREGRILDAQDAIRDAERLRDLIGPHAVEREVVMRVPLDALLEAIDSLEPGDLKRVAERIEKRLAGAA